MTLLLVLGAFAGGEHDEGRSQSERRASLQVISNPDLLSCRGGRSSRGLIISVEDVGEEGDPKRWPLLVLRI